MFESKLQQQDQLMDLFSNELYQQSDKFFKAQQSPDFGPWLDSSSKRNNIPQTSQNPRKISFQKKFLATISTRKTKNNFSESEFMNNNKFTEDSQHMTEVLCLQSKRKKQCRIKNIKQLSPKQSKQSSRSRQNQQFDRWQPLNTTTYLYDNQINKGFFKNAVAIENNRHSKSSYGSKNLQRILKMKEKIRVKNNSYVKKLKQKLNTVNSPYEHFKQSPPDNYLPSKDIKWKSTTLVVNPQTKQLPQKQKTPYRSKRLVFMRQKNSLI